MAQIDGVLTGVILRPFAFEDGSPQVQASRSAVLLYETQQLGAADDLLFAGPGGAVFFAGHGLSPLTPTCRSPLSRARARG